MNERAIFDAASEIPDPDRRRACLDQFCGGDAVLRARIEALLESHESSSQFLNVPAVEQFKSTATPTGQPTAMQQNPGDAGHGLRQDDDSDGELTVEPDLCFLSPSSKPDSIGTLGHYEILQVLGQGAFGIVFKAFDEKLHRLVAIKVLNPQLAATSPPRKRFLREARSAAAIRHENIVQVYSVEEQPLPYLVMEYIDGQTLQQKLDGAGPLELPELLNIGRQLAAGLAAAHAKGLIHRDIKPGNILLEKGVEHRVKITDFGLARAADDASLTRSGFISGTPMYMAPEQAMGVPHDHRADLFSLGSVLYVMASGRPPFRADRPIAVLKRVTEETPRSIREIIPEVPDWLCAIITKLHSKKREDRFQSAQEVADLLARCQSEIQQHGRVDSLGEVSPMAPVVPNAKKPEPQSRQPAPNKAKAALDNPLSRRHRWLALAATILVLIVGLGLTEATGVTNVQGIVIRLFSPAGTLVVEVDDPGVSVSIDGEELVITGNGAKEIRLTPGQYKLLASKEGKLVHQELVTVTRHGRQVVRVTQETEAEAIDSNRKAAEYVLSIGGKVRLHGVDREINAVDDLPQEQFELAAIMLHRNQQVTDAGLAACSGCKNLAHLDLVNTKISDAGLACFQNCKNLKSLWLGGIKLTDNGLAYFQECQNLTEVYLDGTNVNDSGLTHLKNSKNLATLSLTKTSVCDAGLTHLKDFNNLTVLYLQETKTTAAGIDSLRKALPACKIEWDGGTTKPSDISASEKPGFVPLFNGKDLKGWETKGNANAEWKVRDGVLLGSWRDSDVSMGSVIYTHRNDYQNFRFRVQTTLCENWSASMRFLWPNANTRGGFIRAVIGSTSGPDAGDTAILRRSTSSPPLAIPMEPVQLRKNEWFTQEVVVQGRKIQILINNILRTEYELPEQPLPGHLGIELSGGATIRIRKIEVQELPATVVEP